MKYLSHVCLLLFIFATSSVHTKAEDYAGNTVYVKSSPHGQCYAKAIPAELSGSKGVTRIYVVREGEDQLVETYSWYAQQIDLQVTAWGISVVRINSWRRGQKPTAGDLAIGFYLAGKTLKEYSTLDIARIDYGSSGDPFYTGIVKANGYRWIQSNDYTFSILTGGGKTISFDVRTGALSAQANNSFNPSPR